MSIKFNIVERGRPGVSEAPKKYYPSIQSMGRVSMRQLAERASDMSTMSTPCSRRNVTAVDCGISKGMILETKQFLRGVWHTP